MAVKSFNCEFFNLSHAIFQFLLRSGVKIRLGVDGYYALRVPYLQITFLLIKITKVPIRNFMVELSL